MVLLKLKVSLEVYQMVLRQVNRKALLEVYLMVSQLEYLMVLQLEYLMASQLGYQKE